MPDMLPLPSTLNLGSGKSFDESCLNVDIDRSWAPDIAVDMSSPVLGCAYATARFGDVRLNHETFDTIVANDVLEHVHNLLALMTNVLMLLKVGGALYVNVPYDLSLGAWQDPTHVRAFNENSWLYYTDWWWYSFDPELGARFDMKGLFFNESEYGRTILANPRPFERVAVVAREQVLLRTPRAIDSMTVILAKRLVTEAERIEGFARRHRTP